MGRVQHQKTGAERNAKAAAYKRDHRRRLLLSNSFGSLGIEAFSSPELFQLMCGSSRQARSTFARSCRRNEVRVFPNTKGAEGGVKVLPRPKRILSRLNRSSVFPPIVSNDRPIEELAVVKILASLQAERNSLPPHRLLDRLTVASGLPWETCADLLSATRLAKDIIENYVVEATRRARSFWNRFQQGRARYARLVAKGQIPGLRGDWAFFEASEFQRLLPGIVIPKRLRRHEYLTRWVTESSPVSLDVYAGLDGAPLFRHPFPEQFNPLSFGQPPRKTKAINNRRN